jgi:pimeloyl-ACP methyl ester carboxylesterase
MFNFVHVALSASVLMLPPQSANTWRDPSPHKSEFVQIRGARLHYLDWGGTGPVILFLHGSGSTAHDFDDIAPKFTDQFRVLALTRRGYGESDKLKGGYNLKTFASDVREFLDALHVNKAIVAGHSAGGLVVTEFAARYPNRVSHVIYLDTTFNGPDVHAIPKRFPPPPFFNMTDEDQKSYDMMGRYFKRLLGVWTPAQENSVREMGHFGTDGKIQWVTSDAAREQMGNILMGSRQDYARVKVSGLYIYATPTAEERFPYLVEQNDAAGLEKARKYNARHLELRREDIERLKRVHPEWTVVEMPHATHHFFYEQPGVAVRTIQDFLLGRLR